MSFVFLTLYPTSSSKRITNKYYSKMELQYQLPPNKAASDIAAPFKLIQKLFVQACHSYALHISRPLRI